MTLNKLSLAASVFVIAGTSACADVQWTAVNLHPAGAASSYGNSGFGGQQVGYIYNSSNQFRASVWEGTAASWVEVHPSDFWLYSMINDTSGTQFVGYVENATQKHACLWNGVNGSRVDLTPSATEASAAAIAGGLICGWMFVGGAAHASLWTGTPESWVDIHPAAASESRCYGMSASQQAGRTIMGGVIRAAAWNGSAASWIDLHPAGATQSEAYWTNGTQQSGYATVGGVISAAMWSGTPETFVNLNPAGSTYSEIFASDGELQVGWAELGGVKRAGLWTGSAASWVNLADALGPGWGTSRGLHVWEDAVNIHVSGYAHHIERNRDEAILWSRRASNCSAADIGAAGGLPGHDDQLDNNDFIVFITYFFNHNPLADRGVSGGFPGSDGLFDNNDFIAFINEFFAGCDA